MTAKDIETLFDAFNNVPYEELDTLDSAQFRWLRRLKGLSLVAAVDAIRSTLKATQNEKERLNRVVELYSWLALRGLIRQWDLHRLDRNMEDLGPSHIVYMLWEAIEYHDPDSVGSIVDAEDAVYFCVMTKDVESELLEHTLLCFCIKPELPFFAVHTAGDLHHVPKIWTALSMALGEWRDSIHGTYDDLNAAFAGVP